MAAQSPCGYAPVQQGPLTPSCIDLTHMTTTWTGTSQDQSTDLCKVVQGAYEINNLCEDAPVGADCHLVDVFATSSFTATSHSFLTLAEHDSI